MKYFWIIILLFLISFTDVQTEGTTTILPSTSTDSLTSSKSSTSTASGSSTDKTSVDSTKDTSTATLSTAASSKDNSNDSIASGINTLPNTGMSSSTKETTTSPFTTMPVMTNNDNSSTESSSSKGEASTTVLGTSAVVTSTTVATAALATTVRSAAGLLPGVKISETNLLLTDSDSDDLFVEMKIDTDVNNVWLVILDASNSSEDKILLNCTINKNSKGFYTQVINNETQFWNTTRNMESVMIALYADENSADKLMRDDGLYDFLLYSSCGNINVDLKNKFANQSLIIDHKKLKELHNLSLSRCLEDEEEANTVAVLTYKSPNKVNLCNLTLSKSLEMKLTRDEKDCSSEPIPDFNKSLAIRVISDVNLKEHCGFAFLMLSDMNIDNSCSSKIKEIDIQFTVKSAFSDQLSLIVSGYQNFVSSQPKLTIDNKTYDLIGCFENCFHKGTPPTDSDGDKVRVTVAVVVTSITVFLVVLLFIFLYLKRKKTGILQFSMSRLDEDDDLIGDMDDFVGNQGPTFRSFK